MKKQPKFHIITHERIIKALRTEPLKSGHWVENPDLEEVGNCGVCAVGAVLRSCRFTNNKINAVGDILLDYIEYRGSMQDSIENALASQQWMVALSNAFEFFDRYRDLSKDNDRRSVVNKTITFVKRNLPKRFKIPAKVRCTFNFNARTQTWSRNRSRSQEEIDAWLYPSGLMV